MKYTIRINPVASSDLQSIVVYISEDNPTAALQVGKSIYSKIEGLADFPDMGALVSSKINLETNYRFLVCGNYLIFYKVEGLFISVYRILNGARDYLSILFSDLPED